MKKTLIVFFCALAGWTAMSQSKDYSKLLDELRQRSKKDTAYVNQINDFFINYHFTNRSGIGGKQEDSLATIALDVSRKINYSTGVAEALVNRAFAKLAESNNQEAIGFAEEAEKIAEENNDPVTTIYALLVKASAYAGLNERQKNISTLIKAEGIAETLPDKRLLSWCQTALGGTYSVQFSDYPTAIDWTLKALHTAELTNDPLSFANAYRILGDVYSVLGDNEKGLSYYKKSQHIVDSLGIIWSTLFNSIGESNRLTGRYPEAIAAYQKGLKIDDAPYRVELYQSNIADVYVRMNNLSKAFEYGFASLDVAKKINDLAGVSWIDNIISRAYLKKNMQDSALYFATEGMKAAKETNYLEFLRDNAQVLALIYAQKEDYKNAYEYHTQYIVYRDSMNNAQVSNQANLLQYNYNMAKTQARIDGLNADKKYQRNILLGALTVLLLIILGAILLLRNNRQKRKANSLLQKSYDNVEKLEDIGRKITSSLSVENIISTVYTNVNALMDASVFGIGIYNDAAKRIEFAATYEKGKPLPFYSNSIEDKNRFAVVCFENDREIVLGDLSEEYKNYIETIHTISVGDEPLSVIFLPLVSKGKKLGVLTVQSFKRNAYTEYHLYMLRNIAIYTSIALENASSYQELKSAQAQLIQSEKMASLGELTAGIAHEIQNPLNFVNNFSEVNAELLEEQLDEFDKGNLEEARQLCLEIAENERKIIHHGKRADSIVKGMLQHSRSSSGQKEAADINAMCDECLRLSYHGYRAKEKTFNADFKTGFDESIGQINLVPQDMGRVLLNLLNNAFYATGEKNKRSTTRPPGVRYQPLVSVTTKNLGNHVVITISDNGEGMPKEVEAKIFQPFFTTKPTGSGTGLGLSLSYDIIKAHGGEIKVISKEGEGSEFIIEIPR